MHVSVFEHVNLHVESVHTPQTHKCTKHMCICTAIAIVAGYVVVCLGGIIHRLFTQVQAEVHRVDIFVTVMSLLSIAIPIWTTDMKRTVYSVGSQLLSIIENGALTTIE